jgi:8-oxo-dGTP diphosphatase
MVEPANNIRIRVAGICRDKKGRLLLVNHKKNGRSYWLIPGGGVEYGETLHQALRREFMEELSLKVTKVGDMVFMHDTIYPDGKRHILNLYFLVNVSGKMKANPDKVLAGAEYTGKVEFKKILFYPDIKDVIIRLWSKGFSRPSGYIKTKWKD